MLQAGVARTNLTPFWGVELAGWGYYLERRWQRVSDPLFATALVFESDGTAVILVTLDLMVIDVAFTQRTRQLIQEATGVPAASILLTCSHSHNAPAAGGLRGVGECDPVYEDWAARQAATAAILAWNEREPATLASGHQIVDGLTFNRTRENGVVDATLTAARIDRREGTPLAILVNYAGHPTLATEARPHSVSRDLPGAICDRLESKYPGALALYIQGACGDTNFHRKFHTVDGINHVSQTLADAASQILSDARRHSDQTVRAVSRMIPLPTRRWLREEIEEDRTEAERRLATKDVTGWRETLGRSMTNRPDDMVARHGRDEGKAVEAMCRFHLEWTVEMLRDYQTREEVLQTEVQGIRIGEMVIVSNSAELFSPFALEVRRIVSVPDLMIACYSNGRIGYLPDAHDLERRSYAGIQSPKYCNQFPFTSESGAVMCSRMCDVIGLCSEV